MLRTPLASARLGFLACACVGLAAGCANGPGGLGGLGGFGGRWFSWVRPARTQAEIEQAKATKAAAELEHPERVHLAHAQWREQSGDFAAARSSYQYVLAEQPDSIEALIGMARIDQMTGRFDEAERRFRKALDIRPNSPLALNALGQFYAAEERWGAAIPLLRSAAQATPDDPKYQHHLGVALARSGHVDEALPHFTRSVGAAEAHYNVAYLLHEQGQDGPAIDHLQTALRMKPDLHNAADLLAELTGMPAPSPHGMVPSGRFVQQSQPPAQPPAKVTRIPVTEIRQTGSEVYEQAKSRYAEPASYDAYQTPPVASTMQPAALPAPPTRTTIQPNYANPMNRTSRTMTAAPQMTPQAAPQLTPQVTSPPQLASPPSRLSEPTQPGQRTQPVRPAVAPVVRVPIGQPAVSPAATRPAPTGWRPHGSAQQEQRANQRPAP